MSETVKAVDLVTIPPSLKVLKKKQDIKALIVEQLKNIDGINAHRLNPDIYMLVMSLIENLFRKKNIKGKLDKKQLCIDIVSSVCTPSLTEKEIITASQLIDFIHINDKIEIVSNISILVANFMKIIKGIVF